MSLRLSPRVLAAWLIIGFAGVAGAAPTAEQKQEVAAINTLVGKATTLYKAGKFKEAGESLQEAQQKIETLAASADGPLLNLLAPAHRKVKNAAPLLELEGVKLPPIAPLEGGKPAKPGADKPGAGDPAKPTGGEVSFTKQVAPIILAHCGGCHVRNARGKLSMANYESLMKGSEAGKIVFPGKVDGSDFIQKVKDKEMPPNGAGIPAEELATLTKWVADGAKFDGEDQKMNLNELTRGLKGVEKPMIAVAMATGKETISFSRDIAPVLAETCARCHGAGPQNPSGNFNLNTFEGLLKGGDAGVCIQPGKGAESFIIKKLLGTATGQRMPAGGLPPLESDVIAKIQKWIDEGATFDSPDAKQPVAEVAAIFKARNSTHEQLSADRAKLAEQHWRLAMPDASPDKLETANYLVLGDVGENTLKQIGEQAEKMAPQVAKFFAAPASDPLVKGRMTLFVFKDRYGYSQLGEMVEKRELPRQWRGHFKFSIVDAYAAVVPPRANDYSLQTLIAQQLAAGHVAALGKGGSPNWFAQGAGRVAASRLDGGDKRVSDWDDAVPQIVSTMKAPDDFLTGKLGAEDADICSYSFVKFLMTDSKRFNSLLDHLRKGGEFAKSFSDTYGAAPNQLCDAWIRKPPSRSVPAKKTGKK